MPPQLGEVLLLLTTITAYEAKFGYRDSSAPTFASLY